MPDRLLPKLLTMTTAAILSGRSPKALHDAIARGQLAAIHYGTLHSIPTAELERWLGREISRDEYLAAERRQDASRDAARERAAWRRLEAEPKIEPRPSAN